VWEWADDQLYSDTDLHRLLGGTFRSYDYQLTKETIYFADYGTTASREHGFRLVMIPEPSAGLLMIAGLVGLAGWRRVRA
jgi:hypothetical protein